MAHVQALVERPEMATYRNTPGWRGERPPQAISTVDQQPKKEVFPERRATFEEKHKDPGSYPYHGMTDEQLDEDRNAHSDYGWLSDQVEERKRNRDKKDEDEK